MSRCRYDDEGDYNLWEGALVRAFSGRRGQAFLRDAVAALDRLEPRRLIAEELVEGGEVCALGAVAKARGLDVSGVDSDDVRRLSRLLGIAPSMVAEILFVNDEGGPSGETPEWRHDRVLRWLRACLVA